jgi:purine-nucleoside phosphorylase
MFRYAKFIPLVFLLLVISGCQTAKGFSKGMKGTATGIMGVGTGVTSTVVYTTEGAVKDTHTAYNLIGALDDWIKENLW